MYSTSEALTNAIINGEPINKELRLLDSDGVVIKTIKSLKLYSGSNSTSRIQIGSTNSSYIEASIEYDKVLANREMELYCGIDSEMIPMGIYKIMQEPSEDDGIISFKAYDRMRLLDKLYEPKVAIPNGFKNVVDDIAKQCGVTVNFSYTGGTVRNYIKGYTCREMIGYIASMLGTFAYFDRQGVLNFGWYAWGKPVEKTLSSFWSLKKDSNNYKVTGVEFIASSDTRWLAGSEPNIIYCSNPLADLKDAENVYYGPMRDLTYRPAEISMLDDIRLDVTDVVKVTLLDGTTIVVPCMTLNQDFTASETKVKAVGNADGEASNYSGPLTTAMDRLTTDLLLTNRVVVGAKKTADEIKENIYSPNTTTIDGGKITTNSIKAKQIDVTNLFAQDITASGTITGAKLYGTYLESTSGKIADFNITENGFSRELDWVDQWDSSAATITGSYKAWCEITPNGSGQINIGAGVGTFTYKCPTIRCGYYDRSEDGTVTKITSFETDMMGISTNYFKADKIISDLIPIPATDDVPTPSGYRATFPNLGSPQQTWQNLYVKSIYVKAGIGDVGDETTGNIEASGKITAQGDIIAGLGTDKQVSLQGLKDTTTQIRGKSIFSINNYGAGASKKGSSVSLWKDSATLTHGFYIAIISAVISTNTGTSRIELLANGNVLVAARTNSTTYERVLAVHNFGVSGEQSFNFELVAKSQDASSTVTVPGYRTYSVLIFKIG